MPIQTVAGKSVEQYAVELKVGGTREVSLHGASVQKTAATLRFFLVHEAVRRILERHGAATAEAYKIASFVKSRALCAPFLQDNVLMRCHHGFFNIDGFCTNNSWCLVLPSSACPLCCDFHESCHAELRFLIDTFALFFSLQIFEIHKLLGEGTTFQRCVQTGDLRGVPVLLVSPAYWNGPCCIS